MTGTAEGIYRGRVSKGLSERAKKFVSSINVDGGILEDDLDGTEAHELMLYEQGILSREELSKILTALEKIREEHKKGKIKLDPKFEDVHEFAESKVISEVGVEIGGKIHTGRSRNDQVALDIRMRLRRELNELSSSLLRLIETILKLAERNIETPMPLFTHIQHAQIGTFGHYLLAQVDILMRDFDRLDECYCRVNLSPLGGCAIGGSSFELDRKRTADILGFDGVVENSLDAVSSRDVVLEAAAIISILMADLSRMAEDLILWSTPEFGYIELSDEYSSTSSAMPQKKNPCTLELIRGKTGGVYGSLFSLLTTMKGLASGYNRDLQETKPPIWRCVDEAKGCVDVLEGVIGTMLVRRERMLGVSSESYALAWDLAEGLVKETGLSFRESHAVVGEVVKDALSSGLTVREITGELIEAAAEKVLGKKIKVDQRVVNTYLDPISSLKQRKTLGSPSPEEVSRMLKRRRGELKEREGKLNKRVKKVEKARGELEKKVKGYISGRGR